MDIPEARDVMKKRVLVVNEDESVLELSRKMKKKKARGAVVVSKGKVVGIVVDSDITRKVVAENLNPKKIKVSQIMTKNPITVSEYDSVEEVSRLMVEHNISRIPVVSGGKLQGIIEDIDILKVWPSYLDFIQEEMPLEETEEEYSGICESCGNYSDHLVLVNNMLLCPTCRENL